MKPIVVKSATPGIDGTRPIDGLSDADRYDFAFLYGTIAGFVVGFAVASFALLVLM